jgi:hypothetical protein
MDGALSPGMGGTWFERLYAYPTFFELGNVLTTVLRDLEIYNSHRTVDQQVTSFTNNVDAGVSLVGFPSTPFTLAIQHGTQFQVEFNTSGPPALEGTLDWGTTLGLVSVPVTGSRVVMFPFEPETPIREVLEFATDVIRGVQGTEQRVSVRRHPRQLINMRLLVEDDRQRRRLQALLSTWHPRVFGLPVWFEARPLSAAAANGDTVINVDTSYADFRAGSLAIVWKNSSEFDALEIQSITPTTLTLSSPVSYDYDWALVMPLRVAVTGSQIGRAAWPVNLTEIDLSFTTLDNQVDLADVSAFSTHNSKVMLDGPNLMNGRLDDSLTRQIERLDNTAGALEQFSDWDSSLPRTAKGFLADSPQQVWQVRQLVHALRGSQVSFYLPTFYHDLVITGQLTNGSVLAEIENVGYTGYINGQEPNKSLWIELNDGTVITRQVVGSEVLDAETERLTVDVAWSADVDAADIRRVSFLRLVRIADDKVTFDHDYTGDAKVTMSLIGVFR